MRVVRASHAPWQVDRSGARFWGTALDHLSFTYFDVGPGTRFSEHRHEAEQITMVIRGSLEFEVDGEHLRIGPGDAIALPGGIPHAVRAGADGALAVDAWSPPQTHLGAP